MRDLLWRFWYAGNRARLVLALIALAILLMRRLRVYRGLMGAGLIGGIVVVGWLLVGPLLTIPRFTTEGPVVRNGVAAVTVCGEKQHEFEGMDAAMKYVPEPRTGSWWPVTEDECTTWYHRPPGFEQRHNRQVRAEEEVAVATCGTKRDLFATLEQIPEPATGTWGTLPRGACKVQYPPQSDPW